MRLIHGALSYCKFTDQIMPVLRAKVPIVQFKLHLDDNFNKHRNQAQLNERILDADISYYNTLAMHNSRLLATYCELWPELRQLGVFVKAWAKDNFIGDAACGSISSYGHMLMLIHFLQQSDILPVLTEDPWLEECVPRRFCEGFDVTFVDKAGLQEAKRRCNWRKPTRTVGQYFLDYLDFYAQYDFENQVVQIRTKKMVSIEEKREENSQIKTMIQWALDRHMYIEDPFERTHNLPSGVRERMVVYIQHCFAYARVKLWKAKNLKEELNLAIPSKKEQVRASGDHEISGKTPKKTAPAESLLMLCRNPKKPPESRERCKHCFLPGHYAGNCPRKDDMVLRQQKFDKRKSGNCGNDGKMGSNFQTKADHFQNKKKGRNNEGHLPQQGEKRKDNAVILEDSGIAIEPFHKPLPPPIHGAPGVLTIPQSLIGPKPTTSTAPSSQRQNGSYQSSTEEYVPLRNGQLREKYIFDYHTIDPNPSNETGRHDQKSKSRGRGGKKRDGQGKNPQS